MVVVFNGPGINTAVEYTELPRPGDYVSYNSLKYIVTAIEQRTKKWKLLFRKEDIDLWLKSKFGVVEIKNN